MDHGDAASRAQVLCGLRALPHAPEFCLVPLHKCVVNALDSGFMLGDGLWEGLRLTNGVIFRLEKHIERLYESSLALDMHMDIPPEEMVKLIYRVVDANEMVNGVHMRLMISRGLKPTGFQSPYITIGPPTITIVPEFKEPSAELFDRGLRLFTAHVRRPAPDTQDPALNAHSKHVCIQACIQAHHAGYDEALMLDQNGFVATCNSTNFFIVKNGVVIAPTKKYQLRGITRETVIEVCKKDGIPVHEEDFSLADVYAADECFVTGTFAGVVPVREVDGRRINDPSVRFGSASKASQASQVCIIQRISSLYRALVIAEAKRGRYPHE